MTRVAVNLGQVAALVRHAGDHIVAPRFRALASDEVSEKSPGEVVTIADRESEAWLADRLTDVLRDARVVGEEACDADPVLMAQLDRGLVWLIDPLDGTRNFANGNPHFAVMVALVEDGVTIAGWIYHPLTRTMHSAHLGNGAFVEGARVSTRTSGLADLRGALPAYYADSDTRQSLGVLAGLIAEPLPGLMCAGADYPRCVDGTQDFALFWRSLPWDHAAGALFLNEAGGKVAWADGAPYAIGNTRPGLIAAATPEVWERAVECIKRANVGI